MKKLLGILVLSLGLMVNTNAEVKTKIDLSFCWISQNNIFVIPTDRQKLNFHLENCDAYDGKKITYQDFLQKAFYLKHICFIPRNNRVMSKKSPCIEDSGQLKVYYENGSFYYTSTETPTQQVAEKTEKSNADFCLNNLGQVKVISKSVGSKGCAYEWKKISMRQYIDIRISLYLRDPYYSDASENAYISALKSFKRTFTKLNLDTTYLDSKIIKNFSNKVNKNKLLTALNIAKEPTEEQILASLNMTKEEYEQKIKEEKKEQEEQRLKAEKQKLIEEEQKKQREEVQRLVDEEEKKQTDPVYRAESELSISIERATQETDKIKINEGYALNCEAEIEDFSLIFNQKVVKSKILESEVIVDFEQNGQVYIKMKLKISSSGKLSNSKLKIHYSPDFDKDLKHSIKPYMNMFKQIAKESFSSFDLYGKTLTPIQIENKKQSKTSLSLMKKMFANDAEMKGFLKKLKVKVYDHYLGTTSIQSEKFYILHNYMTMEHPDESFLDDVGEEMSQTTYTIIHIDSGYNLQFVKEMPVICTIYKQDEELIKLDTSEIFN